MSFDQKNVRECEREREGEWESGFLSMRCSAEISQNSGLHWFYTGNRVARWILRSSTRSQTDSRARNTLKLRWRQHTATQTVTHWSTPQHTSEHTATHCNTLQHTLEHAATHCNTPWSTLHHTATHLAAHCNALQPVQTWVAEPQTLWNWTRGNTLQHILEHSHILHHTATHRNTRQPLQRRSAEPKTLENWQRGKSLQHKTATQCNKLLHTPTHSNQIKDGQQGPKPF